jgi:hypothetical protein
MREKGFLGPIGDDLPSLIPLLFALMIFFATYSFALNEFTLENQEINNKLEVLRISRIIRTDGLIDSHQDFNHLCDTIPLTTVKFKAGLVDYWADPGSVRLRGAADVIDDVDSGNPFMCVSKGLTIDEATDIEARRIYSLIYPVALQQDKKVLPVHLVVVAWRD